MVSFVLPIILKPVKLCDTQDLQALYISANHFFYHSSHYHFIFPNEHSYPAMCEYFSPFETVKS